MRLTAASESWRTGIGRLAQVRPSLTARPLPREVYLPSHDAHRNTRALASSGSIRSDSARLYRPPSLAQIRGILRGMARIIPLMKFAPYSNIYLHISLLYQNI